MQTLHAPLDNESAKKMIIEAVPGLNENQINAITTVDGPLQIIAGPGSGKTLVLVLRAMYILLTSRAQPSEIVMTTYTEKAAFELRDRLHQFATKSGYKGPLYEMKIGTIHSICDDFIRQMINFTPLKKNYEVLDELTHSLFINDKFRTIMPEDQVMINDRFLGRWQYKWTAIKEVILYFDKIAEELIDVRQLLSSQDPFLIRLGRAYSNYEDALFSANRIDFSHQQKVVYDMLKKPDLQKKIKQNIKYIMVDEYQDTNYVQEQILLKLAAPENNICIVGDEDQSLYRFRGATVRNILEFQSHFSSCQNIVLDINYRSHSRIIEFYNRFMQAMDWSNADGRRNFRFDKTIRANQKQQFDNYPAVFLIVEPTPDNEAEQFGEMVQYLKDNNIVEDYSQIALLLHSVRLEKSGPYIQALQRRGIPYYNPRARGFFDND